MVEIGVIVVRVKCRVEVDSLFRKRGGHLQQSLVGGMTTKGRHGSPSQQSQGSRVVGESHCGDLANLYSWLFGALYSSGVFDCLRQDQIVKLFIFAEDFNSLVRN